MIEGCLTFRITKKITTETDENSLRKILREEYKTAIEKIEKAGHRKIRKNFKHNIFNYDLPPHSILHEDLFDEKTWQVLGLTPRQLITAAGLTGGTMGVVFDLATAGLSFGIFTAIGGLAGAGWTAFGGGKRLAKTKVLGLNLGGQLMRIGPIGNIQFMYVLVDRAMIFYSHIINWAHGRRDYPDTTSQSPETQKTGFTSQWNKRIKNRSRDYYVSIGLGDEEKRARSRRAFKELLQEQLLQISLSDKVYDEW
jgi:hypothetical protein